MSDREAGRGGYRIVESSSLAASGIEHDVEAFIRGLAIHAAPSEAAGGSFFAPERDLVVTRAPGRLDVLGGIADYSGSLVLELPTEEATIAALQLDPAPEIRALSLAGEDGRRERSFSLPLAALHAGGSPIEYQAARDLFRSDPANHWAAYVLGAFLVLEREKGFRFREGARILIASSVPEGKGVASSAALEVAAMGTVAAAHGIVLEPRELAILCQRVENLVAGAPCGVMDQMTSVLGEKGKLLALHCQPAEVAGQVSIPSGLGLWGIDSGIRHYVSGASYGAVRTGAFMGAQILAPPAGYLANLTPSEFEARAAFLPEEISGKDFLARWGSSPDPVTRVDPEAAYQVRAPASHPVRENFRVRAFRKLLEEPLDEARMAKLGELLYQSHESYSALGLGSPGTDRLVELVQEAGPGRGLFGAKITGGGSGGTVAVLGRNDAGEAVAEIAARYARETGRPARVISGSSSGAARFGHLLLRWISS